MSMRSLKSVLLVSAFIFGVFFGGWFSVILILLIVTFLGKRWYLAAVFLTSIGQYLIPVYKNLTVEFTIYFLIAIFSVVQLLKKKILHVNRFGLTIIAYTILIIFSGLIAAINDRLGSFISWNYEILVREVFLVNVTRTVFAFVFFQFLVYEDNLFFEESVKNLVLTSSIGVPALLYLSYFSGIINELNIGGGLFRLSIGKSDPNYFAVTLINFLVLALFAMFQSSVLKIVFLFVSLVMPSLHFILLTGSRGALINLLIVILVVAFVSLKFESNLRRNKARALVILITSSLISFYMAWRFGFFQIVLRRLEANNIFELTSGRNLQYRTMLELMKAGSLSNILFGWGGTSYTSIMYNLDISGIYNVMHNTLLEILVQRGLSGVFLYLIIIATVIRSVAKSGKLKTENLILPVFVVFLNSSIIHSFHLMWEFNELTWFLGPFLVAWANVTNSGGKHLCDWKNIN